MSDKTELLPCPFCGGGATSDAHAEDCYFSVLEAFNKALNNADMSLAQEVLHAWNRRATLAQQPAPVAVPDGWKLVPIHATKEQRNAVCMHPDLAQSIYRTMVAAAAPAAQEPVQMHHELLLSIAKRGTPPDGCNYCPQCGSSRQAIDELRALLAGKNKD